MKTFNVYKHPVIGFEAVKVGFSWPAFFFCHFWMLIKRLWGFAGLWFGAYVACSIIAVVINKSYEGWVLICVYSALFVVYLALGLIPLFKGNKWIEKSLLRRGYELLKSVQAENPDAAIAKLSKVHDDPHVVPNKKVIVLVVWFGMGLIFVIIGGFLCKSFVVKESTQQSFSKSEIEYSLLDVIDFELTGPRGNEYIVGTVINRTEKQYSYAQIEFNLYDESGAQVGSTFANINNLEPYGTWKFKAIVFEDRATRAKLKGVSGF